jgi:hypothetical protein
MITWILMLTCVCVLSILVGYDYMDTDVDMCVCVKCISGLWLHSYDHICLKEENENQKG